MTTFFTNPRETDGKGRNGYFGVRTIGVRRTTEPSWLGGKEMGSRISIDVEGVRGVATARIVMKEADARKLVDALLAAIE
jgi:hypothetical protein